MAKTPNIVIDPLTRIEGHLRVEAVAENGVITDAWVAGTLYRGMETVLKGRAPEDAFYITQRICGVCPMSHGHASSMAVDSAFGITIPNGARLVRNILEMSEFLHSHILWFYTLAALDYVNPAKALAADIAQTHALAVAAGTGTSDFGAVQKRLLKLVEGGDLSIFTNGWWKYNPLEDPAGADSLYNPEMPAELHLIAVAHYLEALEMQSEASRVLAIMGGKFPHMMTSVAGGTAWVPTEAKVDDVLYRLKRVQEWVWGTMIPDTLAIAPYYAAALDFGGGVGNFLAWGVFNRESMEMKDRYLPSGYIMGKQGLTVQQPDAAKVAEYVEHSWYTSPSGLHPAEGKTVAISEWTDSTRDLDGQYSWAKAPRYEDEPMEVGPLARMLVGYLDASSASHEKIKGIIDYALGALGITDPTKLISLLGRVAARNLETALIADWAVESILELAAVVKSGEASFFQPYEPKDGMGAGLWEAPRGAVGHWLNVEDGRINNYQVITPSSWDISPRDKNGVRGPMEESLIGAPIADVEAPIMAARIVRSFDP